MYIDKDKKNDLVNDYFEYYDLPLEINPGGNKYLVLGGGTCMYPHHYLNKYKGKTIDVVEIDKKCIDYAKRKNGSDNIDYFTMNINNLNLIKEKFDIVFSDMVFNYIDYSLEKYDYILIDLFNGKETIKGIYENNNFDKILKLLNEEGIIIINYIINDEYDRVIIDKITKKVKYFKIIRNEKYYNINNDIGNIIIIVSNYYLK